VALHADRIAVFGLIALALAVVGLIAVVSYAVTDRSREIGVRMALGATQGDVVRLMLAQAAGPAAVGLVAGAAASRALGRRFSHCCSTSAPGIR
jgi:putative ABC transport system permease protein